MSLEEWVITLWSPLPANGQYASNCGYFLYYNHCNSLRDRQGSRHDRPIKSMLVELVQLGNDGLPLMALTLAADEEQDNKTTAVEISTKRRAAYKNAQSVTVNSRYNGLNVGLPTI